MSGKLMLRGRANLPQNDVEGKAAMKTEEVNMYEEDDQVVNDTDNADDDDDEEEGAGTAADDSEAEDRNNNYDDETDSHDSENYPDDGAVAKENEDQDQDDDDDDDDDSEPFGLELIIDDDTIQDELLHHGKSEKGKWTKEEVETYLSISLLFT